MIEYVQPHDPDDRIIAKAVEILHRGGLVAYPTDSSWGIGCSSESKDGLDRLTRLREDKKKEFTLICNNISQMSEVAHLHNEEFRVIKPYVPGPVVFILKPIKRIERKIGIKRPEVGLRIPAHIIPQKLVQALGVPMFSITAGKDMIEEGGDREYPEENLMECGWELEGIEGIDLIIDSGEVLEKRLSTVISLIEGDVEILREGLVKF